MADKAKTVPSATKAPPVPESVLKAKKRRALLAERAKKHAKLDIKRRLTKRRAIFKRAEQYLTQHINAQKAEINQRRAAKRSGNFFVPAEPKLALVIRIRGINQIAPKPKKILQLLRLRQINNAVFVRLTGATSEMLRLVEPYVVYGYPNLKTVRALVYKRGYAKHRGNRLPISDNSVIEKLLGKTGIISVEDLIHEIHTVGPNFKAANSSLWTFKLNPPRGGWKSITTGYSEGGDFGNREEKINKLVQSML